MTRCRSPCDGGDKSTTLKLAAQAVSLGESLLDWTRSHPGKIVPANLVVAQMWYVAALLQVDRFAEALALVERTQRGEDASSVGFGSRIELQLARADALLGLNRAADALPIYTELWPQLAEASDAWVARSSRQSAMPRAARQ